MNTIITLDRANKPYGYPQLDSQGRLSVTGSLFGTASFAVSASYFSGSISNAIFAQSASYAETASYALNVPQTASYALTSSYSLAASQSEFSISASYYAETDPIFVAKSASLATTGSNVFYGTQTVESGSLNVSSGSFNINAQSVFSLATIFTDNYDRSTLSPGGTPSLTYLSGSTSTSGSASIVSNYLNLGNNGTSGSTYATYAIPTINNTLNLNTSSIEWNLNVRTDRTTVFSGFGVGQYGGAIILAGSESDVSSSAGVGYALTYGGETSPNWRSWRLVRYSSSFSNATTVVSPNTHSFSSPSNYVSIKVIYDPTTNIWSLYSRDDGSVAWSTIPLNNSNFVGSAVNTTYTSTPLPYGGFLFNHGAAAGQDLQFDNLFIQAQTSSSITLLTVSPSSGLSYKSGQFTIDQYNTATISGSLVVTNGISGSLFGIANNSISSSWAPMRPAGLDTQIQYNSGSTLTGIGSFTFNYASQSLQQGSSVTASGLYSHAEGLGTTTSGSYQHTQGKYNLLSSTEAAFILGNGSDDLNRSNLIFAAGNTVEITGSLNVSGSITGSLQGTASWANNATTASFAPNLYNTNGTLTSTRTINIGSNSLQISSGSNNYVTVDSQGRVDFRTGSFFYNGMFYVTPITSYVAGNPTARGLTFRYDQTPGNNFGLVASYDWSTGTYQPLFLDASPIRLNAALDAPVSVGVPVATSPTAKLQVRGTGATSLTTAFLVENVSAQSSLVILDDRTVGIRKTPTTTLDVNGNTFISGSLGVSGSGRFTDGLTVTGSFTVITGSSIELQVSNTGVKIGNAITDAHSITGSLNISGSITITSGSITMPNRPAFRVTGSGGAKVAVTTLSGSYLGVDYQQGGGWNTSTGTFTAPISGLYQVNLVCRTNSNSLGTISQIIVYKNNTTISPSPDGTPQIMVEWHSNTTMNHAGGSTISYLAAGDTLKMIVTVGEISFDQNDNFSVAYIG